MQGRKHITFNEISNKKIRFLIIFSIKRTLWVPRNYCKELKDKDLIVKELKKDQFKGMSNVNGNKLNPRDLFGLRHRF